MKKPTYTSLVPMPDWKPLFSETPLPEAPKSICVPLRSDPCPTIYLDEIKTQHFDLLTDQFIPAKETFMKNPCLEIPVSPLGQGPRLAFGPKKAPRFNFRNAAPNWLLVRMEEAASAEAKEWAGGEVTVNSINHFEIMNPIQEGDIVSIYTRLSCGLHSDPLIVRVKVSVSRKGGPHFDVVDGAEIGYRRVA